MKVMATMMHSQYLAVAKAAIKHVQSTVRYRGLNTGGGWMRHPLEVPEKFAARLLWAVVGAQRSAQSDASLDGNYYIGQMDRLAQQTQTGNCAELSAVAYKFLNEQGIRTIEFFGVYRGAWNHAFVVLNRDRAKPVANFSDWSYSAVVCDPLYDRAADAGHLATWYPRMFPLRDLDVKFFAT